MAAGILILAVFLIGVMVGYCVGRDGKDEKRIAQTEKSLSYTSNPFM